LPSSVSRGAGDASLTATSALTYDAVGNITYLDGPLSGSADTSRIIYNQDREVIGTISADPDGAGSLANKATRITYGSSGLITRRELGTTIGQTDAAWSAFSPSNAIDISYDGNRRPITRTLGSGGTNYALTQTSYDNRGRLVCTAVRMNAAAFSSLPSDACTLGTTGSYGPDRIAKATYDVASRISSMQQAYGTSDQATDRAITYTDNGEATALTDAENNLTAYSFDGFDRLIKVTFANPTKGAGTTNSSDYEQISYDANGNVTSRRLRDGNVIYLTLDNLNRLTLKDLPGSEPDVTYSYDNLDRLTSASQTGNSQSYTYDALGRKLTEVGQLGTATSTWNLDGTRATLALPGGGITLTYDRLVTGEVSKIRENGATSGIGVLAAYGYNSLLNRTSVAFGNGVNTSYSYDAVSRLASLSHDVAGTGDDLTIGSISYNPASQIASLTRSNDAYAWTGHGTGSTTTVTNGLNQLATVGGVSGTHDARGNLTADPVSGNGYGYSSENLLSSATVGVYSVTLAYDPTMRLSQVTGPSTTRFGYDGVDLVAEDNGSGILLRRYVPGPGSDEAVVWYEGTGTADRRFLQTDERGSVVGVTDASGNILARNTYDEYGKPGSSNSGRIQYTGQKWIAELGLYDFKNRMYDPRTARFLQTDPIGQADDVNVYTYVAGDPVNKTDPLGLAGEDKDARVEVIGHRGAFGKLLNQRFSIRRAIESFNGLKDDIEREIFIIGSRRVTNAILEAQRYTAQPFIADKEMKVLIAELKLFGEKYPNSRSYDMSILDPEQIWAEIVIIAMKPPYLTSNGTWVVPINDRITAIYYTPTRSPDRSTGIGIRVGGTETKFKWR
jgi:RHS repeat-associated protein